MRGGSQPVVIASPRRGPPQGSPARVRPDRGWRWRRARRRRFDAASRRRGARGRSNGRDAMTRRCVAVWVRGANDITKNTPRPRPPRAARRARRAPPSADVAPSAAPFPARVAARGDRIHSRSPSARSRSRYTSEDCVALVIASLHHTRSTDICYVMRCHVVCFTRVDHQGPL